MLRGQELSRIPYDSITGALFRHVQYEEYTERYELVLNFIGQCEKVAKPGSLAALALEDLRAPKDQGHIIVELVHFSDEPMFTTTVQLCDDCPDEQSIKIKIQFNQAHPFTHLWLARRGPPKDVLRTGIHALERTARLLARELYQNPGKVLYRADFINQITR